MIITSETIHEKIENLKSTSVSNLTDGDIATVLGYYAAGDGGGGSFHLTSSSESIDDGVIFATFDDPSKRWVRFGFKEVRLRQFGAKGDGTGDDLDCINAATSYWLANISNGMRQLVIDGGEYPIRSTWEIRPTASLTTAWGIRSEGATLRPIASGFSGTNVLRITNTPNYQQRGFVAYGPLLIKGSAEVTNAVVMLDGSGSAPSSSYTAWYKSHIRDWSIEGFAFTGTSLHGLLICGNFHETDLEGFRLVGNEAYWNTSGALPTGDAVRFENGSFFAGGAVAHLRCHRFMVTGADRGFHQSNSGDKFTGLRFYDCYIFRTKREGFRFEHSETSRVVDCTCEDTYCTNTDDNDYTKAAIYITYAGAVDNLHVRGNQATGQAKSGVSFYANGPMNIRNVTLSGSCTRRVDSQLQVSGAIFGSEYESGYTSANRPKTNHYGRNLDLVGLRDIVHYASVKTGYDYSGPYAFEVFPNLIKGPHIIIKVDELEYTHPTTNYIDVRGPISEYDRSDQSPANNPAKEIPFHEGHRFRLTLRQNHATKIITYRLNVIFNLSGPIPSISSGQALMIEFQYINGKWIEVYRSAPWTF